MRGEGVAPSVATNCDDRTRKGAGTQLLARANLALVSIVTLVDFEHLRLEPYSHLQRVVVAACPWLALCRCSGDGRMPMRFAPAIITALFLVGCGSPQPVAPSAQITSSPAPSASGTKRIVQDGAGYILPDGTRVAADERGGFRLPNANTSLCWQTVCCCPMGRLAGRCTWRNYLFLLCSAFRVDGGETLKITSLGSCERLICEAIRAHYLRRDEVAVHVLASSCFLPRARLGAS